MLQEDTCPPEETVMMHENISYMLHSPKEEPHIECVFGDGQLGLNLDAETGTILHITEGTQASRWPALMEGDYIVTVQGAYVEDATLIPALIQHAERPVTIGFKKCIAYLKQYQALRRPLQADRRYSYIRPAKPMKTLLEELINRFINVFKRHKLFGAHLFPCYMANSSVGSNDSLHELNRCFQIQETPNQMVMVGVNNGGLHFWDVQRGLIETLDFCELVSWGQTRHHDWTPDSEPNVIQKRKKMNLLTLSGNGTILSAGLQMQTLKINVAVVKPAVIRRNHRVTITDAFDKVAGRVIRADRIARARQARALNLRKLMDRKRREEEEDEMAEGSSRARRPYSYRMKSNQRPNGRSLVNILQDMSVSVDDQGNTVLATGASQKEELQLNEDNAVYSNHYGESDDDEYDEDKEKMDRLLNRNDRSNPIRLSMVSPSIHVLSSLMLQIINGIMASKGLRSK